MSTIQTGTYEKYGVRYGTLTLKDGAYALTVTPEKGGMATSFTKDGEEYLWLRDKNFESTDRPAAVSPFCSPTAANRMMAYIILGMRPAPSRFTAWPTWCPGRSRRRQMMPLN